ncbi:uncharacterized protein (DUF924 family) [Plasticicumulans lactativorans]|uniref:Uncharacterized protein (DUF924 family) n=1 Tax=Plasticicumulans lactativorans TaxID=1133106 RepID=A0A4R2L587_9GAMM|nr:DUF924 family protein [Plasticicumulans lactativorans]TCO80952.1 uncharacterized protein (DUF924 family) [Plasticicumulans lactativorans]
MSATPAAAGAVLDDWFGPLASADRFNRDRLERWFGNGRAYDDAIRARFGALHAQAAAGALDEAWPATPAGRLALVVVLDQFSRHIHRGSAAAFANDAHAQRLTLVGLARGDDRQLLPIQRLFFYLPLEHAEDRTLQAVSVAAFERLRDEAPAALAAEFDGFLDYARRHQAVIERFGRFPELNALLGRDSRAEELAFLGDPEHSFL